MIMKCLRQSNPTSSEERGETTTSKLGFTHLAACLGSIVAVIIVVNVINWLN